MTSLSKRNYVLEIIGALTDKATAELIVERLTDEGLLNLGYGDADVDRVLAKFANAFGTTKITKQDRFAAHRLTRKYGAQAVTGIIQLLADNSKEKYAPLLNSVSDLEAKWVSVVNFTAKQITNRDEVVGE